MKKQGLIILVIVLFMSLIQPDYVYAQTSIQDGIEITVETEKEEYQIEELRFIIFEMQSVQEELSDETFFQKYMNCLKKHVGMKMENQFMDDIQQTLYLHFLNE